MSISESVPVEATPDAGSSAANAEAASEPTQLTPKIGKRVNGMDFSMPQTQRFRGRKI